MLKPFISVRMDETTPDRPQLFRTAIDAERDVASIANNPNYHPIEIVPVFKDGQEPIGFYIRIQVDPAGFKGEYKDDLAAAQGGVTRLFNQGNAAGGNRTQAQLDKRQAEFDANKQYSEDYKKARQLEAGTHPTQKTGSMPEAEPVK